MGLVGKTPKYSARRALLKQLIAKKREDSHCIQLRDQCIRDDSFWPGWWHATQVAPLPPKWHANCFCASLLRTAARANSHATSCIEGARLVLKWTMIGQMAIAIALLGFSNLGRSVTPTFLFRNRFLFTNISTLFKNEQKINVGS